VYDAALRCWHGLEGNGAAGLADAIRHTKSKVAERFLAPAVIMLDIDRNQDAAV
jgi:hypothetical protein